MRLSASHGGLAGNRRFQRTISRPSLVPETEFEGKTPSARSLTRASPAKSSVRGRSITSLPARPCPRIWRQRQREWARLLVATCLISQTVLAAARRRQCNQYWGVLACHTPPTVLHTVLLRSQVTNLDLFARRPQPFSASPLRPATPPSANYSGMIRTASVVPSAPLSSHRSSCAHTASPRSRSLPPTPSVDLYMPIQTV